ncbi:sulfotransferase [Shimia ponticola]|uniref:sulfotransferase n=1 Tax=Shimia ponticola TaxID=2582893 RepID=UPI0021054972|nr:sulfotransferase [Shimia ponticola]
MRRGALDPLGKAAGKSFGVKRFVLGIGAHKGGTSWLHSYLSRFDQVELAFKKELHVWDARFMPASKGYQVRPKRLAKFRKTDWLRFAMQRSDRFYEAYFRRKFDQGAQITGEITPAYCGLPTDALVHIRQRILNIGAQPRVVFLMRDPFERCWSAVRYDKRRGKLDAGLSDEETLLRHYQSPAFQMRTRYETVCPRVLQAFGPGEVYFGLYETLFDEPSLEAIGRFLGLPVDKSNLTDRVNASPKGQSVSPRIRDEVRSFYSETYAYCAEHFPQTRALWQ